MSDLCARVDAFFDGELSKDEADEFRAHLATCSACEHELRELAKLEAVVGTHADALHATLVAPRLEAAPRPAAPVVSIARHPRWKRIVPGVAALAMAAAAAWMVLGPRATPPPDSPSGPVALLESPTRSLEARLTYAAADRYRPYDVARAASAGHGEHVSLDALAVLERQKDFHGVAAGLLLGGDRDRAVEYLDRAGRSPDVDVERAVVALGRGQLEDALTLLDPVLRKQPDHKQALWNRALVLRDLHLDLAAAAAFEKVAALGEPGWADEARARARSLRDAYEERAQSWRATMIAGRTMVETGALPSDDMVRRYPSYVTRFLLHALRAAPSRERVLALLPLAVTLDGGDPAAPLARAVNRMAAGDFTRRAPLAAQYAASFPKWMMYDFDDAAIDAFLAKTRAAGEDDLFFGAVEMTGRADRNAPALVAIAAARRDPWMDLVAQGALAGAATGRGDYATAESTLRTTIAACDARHLDYLCATLESQLVELFITLARTAEATAVAESGMRRGRRAAFNRSLDIEAEMADVARQRGAFALMNAYLDEGVLHDPENCLGQRQAADYLAAARLHFLDPAGAKSELERFPRCDAPLVPARVLVLSELDRLGLKTPELDALPDEIARARPQWSASTRAWVDALRGAGIVARDGAEGTALLRGAIDVAHRLPASDTEAKRAAAWARLNLAMDAARRGRADEALDAMSLVDGVGGGAAGSDGRCSLSIGVAYERSFAITKNAAEEAVVSFDAHRTSPDLDPARLVPAEARARLAGCPSIRVFAPAPVNGAPMLLPDDVAWSYSLGGAGAVAAASPPERRVLVTDVEPPAALGLPRLSPWQAEAGTDPKTVWLRGASATPSSVLTSLREATEVEIHAHGLVDLAVSDASMILLSPDDAGRYALTARDVRGTSLRGHPVVVLGACSAAHVAPFDHEPWSLPLAFIGAGARAVFASPAPVGDAEAGPFFEAVLTRVRRGADPAQALRDERVAWLARGANPWIRQVLLFN